MFKNLVHFFFHLIFLSLLDLGQFLNTVYAHTGTENLDLEHRERKRSRGEMMGQTSEERGEMLNAAVCARAGGFL